MSETLYRLVYCSRSRLTSEDGQREQISRILDAARANNARFGITGALLFSAGCFAQTLEGSLPAIERTFERIQRDERHTEVTILQVELSSRRVFGNWTMAFAGDPAGPHPFAGSGISRAFSMPANEAGQEVLSMLERLVQAEDIWGAVA